MKLIAPLFFVILVSCGRELDNSNQVEITQESTCPDTYSPTVQKMLGGMSGANCTDANGFKQGHWCLYGSDDPAKGHPDQAKIEEGSYEDSKKVGSWIYYSPVGAIDSIISYRTSVPKHDRSQINLVDADGLKNGYWIFYGADFPARGYAAGAKLEEGRFEDDIKVGRWIYFGKEGEVDSTVVYESDRFTKV